MSDPSTETHVCVGMFRPTWESCWANPMNSPGCNICCPCGHTLTIVGQSFKHWQQGCYDTPVYRTIEEVVRMQQATPEAPSSPTGQG